ncbi:MAG: hypothetical protein H6512_15965 [Acidimicrobiia bacterium]|nr:hypothetical protein [Acidimicrobiia bacterium]
MYPVPGGGGDDVERLARSDGLRGCADGDRAGCGRERQGVQGIEVVELAIDRIVAVTDALARREVAVVEVEAEAVEALQRQTVRCGHLRSGERLGVAARCLS